MAETGCHVPIPAFYAAYRAKHLSKRFAVKLNGLSVVQRGHLTFSFYLFPSAFLLSTHPISRRPYCP